MNGNTSNLVKAVAQAGLAGVAIFALFILWDLSKDTNLTIRENTKVQAQLTSAIERLSDDLRDRR